MATCVQDTAPTVKGMKNGCWRTATCQSNQMLYLPFRPKLPVWVKAEFKAVTISYTTSVDKKPPLAAIAAGSPWQQRNEVPITVHSTQWHCALYVNQVQSHRGSLVCFAWFCSFFSLRRNTCGWNLLVLRMVFNQRTIHCIRSRFCNKTYTNQWAIRQFSFGNFHPCLHKQS